MKKLNFNWSWGRKKDPPPESNKEPSKPKAAAISPGRVSVDEDNSLLSTLKGMTVMVDPSFRVEVILSLIHIYTTPLLYSYLTHMSHSLWSL